MQQERDAKDRFKGAMTKGILLIAVLESCATSSPKTVKTELLAPTPGERVLSKIAGPPERTEGSLWVDNISRPFLFQDLRASYVGDIVTVKVIENAKGGKETGTKAERESKIKAATKSLFGSTAGTKLGLEADFSNKMDGTGATSRSGTLTADLPSVITAILPNGNRVIEGVREVRVNNEKEILSLKGIIRVEDIGPGNTIPSNRVSDAKIEYIGKGVLNDKNRPGWFARFLDLIWPF